MPEISRNPRGDLKRTEKLERPLVRRVPCRTKEPQPHKRQMIYTNQIYDTMRHTRAMTRADSRKKAMLMDGWKQSTGLKRSPGDPSDLYLAWLLLSGHMGDKELDELQAGFEAAGGWAAYERR